MTHHLVLGAGGVGRSHDSCARRLSATPSPSPPARGASPTAPGRPTTPAPSRSSPLDAGDAAGLTAAARHGCREHRQRRQPAQLHHRGSTDWPPGRRCHARRSRGDRRRARHRRQPLRLRPGRARRCARATRCDRPATRGPCAPTCGPRRWLGTRQGRLRVHRAAMAATTSARARRRARAISTTSSSTRSSPGAPPIVPVGRAGTLRTRGPTCPTSVRFAARLATERPTAGAGPGTCRPRRHAPSTRRPPTSRGLAGVAAPVGCALLPRAARHCGRRGRAVHA